jgi:hypothetical protein
MKELLADATRLGSATATAPASHLGAAVNAAGELIKSGTLVCRC